LAEAKMMITKDIAQKILTAELTKAIPNNVKI